MDEKRFKIIESGGSTKGLFVIVDKKTGVNYLLAKYGLASGLCPLIN
ncbi:MAG: DUF6440 family protein [Velocimicrobium sp.]